MTRRFLKRVLLLFLLLIAVGVFKIGVMVAFHLWPRAVEAPLWTEADLGAGYSALKENDGDRDVIPRIESHQAAMDQLIRLSVAGKQTEVCGGWLEMFRKDREWVESARSLLSQLGALRVIGRDSEMARSLFSCPDVRRELELLDSSRITLRRALIHEYLWAIASLDLIERDTHRLSLLFYNRELTKRDLNRFFRRYTELLEDPKAIPDDVDEIIRKDFPALVRGPFWWLVNPVGRLLERIILPFHLGEQIKEFYEERERLLQQIESSMING